MLPPENFLYGVAIGVVGCFVSTRLARAIIPRIASTSFRSKLNSLDKKADILFYSIAPSTLHALAQSMGPPAAISLGFSDDYSADRIGHFDEGPPAVFSGIFVGYLLADYALCGPKVLGPVMVVHHISASAAWWIFSAARSVQWYCCFLQFNEFSTPFVNARQVMLTAGYPSSGPEVTAASLAMFVVFGLVRIAPLPKVVYNLVTIDFDVLREQTGFGLAALFSVFFAIHVFLQTYWFGLMVRKFLGLMVPARTKKEKKE